MWKLFKKILKPTLRILAHLTLRRFKPTVIGVTGTVGKTSTKKAIAAVLSTKYRVRADEVSLNTEFGFPLAILGTYSEHDLRYIRTNSQKGHYLAKMRFWLSVIMKGWFTLLFGSRLKYPQVIVLEYGADRPGDINYLTRIAKPQIAVITAVGDIPAHGQFYPDVESVAREKSKLIEAVVLERGSIAFNGVVLNKDDKHVMAMYKSTMAAPASTFGFSLDADLCIEHFKQEVDKSKRPMGITFQLVFRNAHSDDTIVPVRILGAVGKAQAYAAAAAAAVGLRCGLNLATIADALSRYQPPSHRLTIVSGINGSLILDDSYNASPLAVNNALEAMYLLPAKRKVCVLGDMRELGSLSKRAHEIVWMTVSEVCDILVTVGEEARGNAQAAEKGGFSVKNSMSFDTVEEAITPVQNLLKSGDLVLIKASLAIGLTKLVDAVRV